MTFVNNLDPDGTPQNVGPLLRSKLFETRIKNLQKNWMESMNLCNILKETNLLSTQKVKKFMLNFTGFNNYYVCLYLKTEALWSNIIVWNNYKRGLESLPAYKPSRARISFKGGHCFLARC